MVYESFSGSDDKSSVLAKFKTFRTAITKKDNENHYLQNYDTKFLTNSLEEETLTEKQSLEAALHVQALSQSSIHLEQNLVIDSNSREIKH